MKIQFALSLFTKQSLLGVSYLRDGQGQLLSDLGATSRRVLICDIRSLMHIIVTLIICVAGQRPQTESSAC
jgi:hypothetical protein